MFERPSSVLVALLLAAMFAFPSVLEAQDLRAGVSAPRKGFQPALPNTLPSLTRAAEQARLRAPAFEEGFFVIPNREFHEGPEDIEGAAVSSPTSTGPQSNPGTNALAVETSFLGASNVDNITPPDPVLDVGPNHVVLVFNTRMAVFDKQGNVIEPLFDADALWTGTTCYGGSNGDPTVHYDEVADRWVVSLVHFSRDLLCIAASQTSDPTGAWHTYVWGNFDTDGDGGVELPDYAHLGLTPDYLTVVAHMFDTGFAGTMWGVIDKAKLYAGDPLTLLYWSGFNYGYLSADIDGPSRSISPWLIGNSGNTFYLRRLDNVNFDTQSGTISTYTLSVNQGENDLCAATREQCIDQPAAWKLEALNYRFMNRIQVRDFGTHFSMLISQTVNAGGGRAGVAWYELRSSGSSWTKWQEGLYAPTDGLFRWMPSVAMNAGGDIGMSFMLSNSTTFPSMGVVTQTAAEGATGSGLFDGAEAVCANGTSAIDQSYKRSGDYANTVVDPVTDTFWAVQEIGRPGVWADWAVWICEFSTEVPVTEAPVADFSASSTSGVAPLSVTFTDLSTNSPTSWSWDFGDGSDASTERFPAHTYTTPGTYSVTLTSTNDFGNDDETKTDYITVSAPPAPVADFSGSPTTGYAPLTVSFTDLSTNSPTSWSWNFGDGATSTEQNPTHEYAVSGTYTVSLSATNAGGSGSETKATYVTVNTPPDPPVAEFSASPTTGEAPLTVSFTDASTNNPTSWNWDFGNGGTSTEQSPTYTYTSAGLYTVSLTATNAGGGDTNAKADLIDVTPPAQVTALAASDIPGLGTVENSYLATHESDDSYQIITEAESGGKPDRRHSEAAHTWSFANVTSGNSVTLEVEARRADNSESDDFEFRYSNDGQNFAPFEPPLVVNSSTEGVYSGSLPPNTSGTLYVRVADTDQSQGHRSLESLFIDYMGIVTSTATQTLAADFTASATTVPVNTTVQFTDLSTGGPTSWSWNFGDGRTATGQNPSHAYTAAGDYTVSLTASNGSESSLETKANYITVTTAPQAQTLTVSAHTVTRISKGPWTNPQARVSIVKSDNQIVEGATVVGSFTEGGGSALSGVTDANGVATIDGAKTRSAPADWCFKVTDVQLSGATFQISGNEDRCESASGGEPLASAAGKTVTLDRGIPTEAQLDQNYPNPFNPTTIVTYGIPEAGQVTLRVFTAAGQEVRTLVSGFKEAGYHSAAFDASSLSAGIYLYVIETGDYRAVRRMTLLK